MNLPGADCRQIWISQIVRTHSPSEACDAGLHVQCVMDQTGCSTPWIQRVGHLGF